MDDEENNLKPESAAQEDYDQNIVLLHGLYKSDQYFFEVAAHDYLGDNSLKLLTNKFGEYDAGFVDDIEFYFCPPAHPKQVVNV